MIIDIFLYVIGTILSAIGLILPDIQLWPQAVFDGWDWLLNGIMDFNVFLLVVDTMFQAAIWFLRFLAYYLLFKLTVKGFNYLRGVGQGLD